jgi:hypothetical protein
MIKFALILFVFAIHSVNSAALAAPTSVMLSEKKLLQTFGLEEFESAILGLSSAIDGKDWCGATVENAKLMMLPLRPIYEKKLALEKKKRSTSSILKSAQHCKETCLCSLFLELLSNRKGLSKTALDSIQAQAKEIGPIEQAACLKRSISLCKTPLLPSLRAIGLKDYHAEGAY